ncbi:MAG: hypothetical protein HWN65_10025 [Candidatus Helarchaeota archaeon]|nr:hypothetical protein [Candidatus Helarchaeota archaeon]
MTEWQKISKKKREQIFNACADNIDELPLSDEEKKKGLIGCYLGGLAELRKREKVCEVTGRTYAPDEETRDEFVEGYCKPSQIDEVVAGIPGSVKKWRDKLLTQKYERQIEGQEDPTEKNRRDAPVSEPDICEKGGKLAPDEKADLAFKEWCDSLIPTPLTPTETELFKSNLGKSEFMTPKSKQNRT